MHILFTMADLRYAQMSGRVGKLKGTLASVLDLKPIVDMKDGVVDVVTQVRSRKRAITQILALMEDTLGTVHPVNLAVLHAEAPEDGQNLLERARQRFDCQLSFLQDLAVSLVANLGPGTLGLIGYRI
jgi:DegV family protein with EDD domain